MKKKKKTKRQKRLRKIEKLISQVEACSACSISRKITGKVFGEGDVIPTLVFVGEAPGEKEDRSGRPFVGKAGKKLRDSIKEIGEDPDKVFICNILKCRPPKNRDPKPKEIKNCIRFLEKQIDILKPNLIVPLGNYATKFFIKSKVGIMKLRGKLKIRGRLRLFPLLHPAWILRNNTDEENQDFRDNLKEAFKLAKEKPDDAPNWYIKLKRRERGTEGK